MSKEAERDAKGISELAASVNARAEHGERRGAGAPADKAAPPRELRESEAPDLGTAPYDNAPFAVSAPTIRRAAETEDLLNGLIAECHYLMREVAMPSAVGTGWEMTRGNFLNRAMELASTGAEVAGAVAKLRIADRVSPEAQGRIIDAVAKTIAEAKPA